ncbi:MAG: CPBP family intramembrane metalloprotease [Anaerolineae bacterium]|jgi:membrane protease YdiL (CAAX protease family)
MEADGNRMEGLHRLGFFVLVLLGGLAIFFLGNPYFQLLPTNRNADYNALLTVFFLAITIFAHRDETKREYGQLAFAFFVAAFANWALGLELFRFPSQSADTPAGYTWDKLSQAIKVIVPSLLLVKLMGFDLGSIYLQRGKVKGWVLVGFGSFIAWTVLGFVVGAGQGKELDSMLASLPLWFTFSLLNAFMEELWFRGLFLKRLTPFLGSGLSVLVLALVFALAHVGVTYVTPGEILLFVLPTFFIGMGAGYVMVKTDSVWGAVLFHAGADVFYALGWTFSSVQ